MIEAGLIRSTVGGDLNVELRFCKSRSDWVVTEAFAAE